MQHSSTNAAFAQAAHYAISNFQVTTSRHKRIQFSDIQLNVTYGSISLFDPTATHHIREAYTCPPVYKMALIYKKGEPIHDPYFLTTILNARFTESIMSPTRRREIQLTRLRYAPPSLTRVSTK